MEKCSHNSTMDTKTQTIKRNQISNVLIVDTLRVSCKDKQNDHKVIKQQWPSIIKIFFLTIRNIGLSKDQSQSNKQTKSADISRDCEIHLTML